MAELAFEKLALALEATRGTAVTPPTHIIPLEGFLAPQQTRYAPTETRGLLAARVRSRGSRRWSDWEAEGGLDTYIMPVFGNMGLQVVTTPSTPSGATLSRLWEFTRAMSTNALKTATMYWGDPNMTEIFRSPFGILQEIEIEADGTGEDGTTLSVSGVAQFPTTETPPTYPAQVVGSLIVPMDIQVWLDTSSAIGTTALTGRVLAATHTIPTGITQKFIPTGAGGSRTFSRAGVQKTNPTTTVVMELLDHTQYDLFDAETAVKLRVRHNGALIETTAGPVSWYEYVEVDGYGYLQFEDWGDLEGTNRTIEFTLEHEYNTTLASDIRLAVQNARTSL